MCVMLWTTVFSGFDRHLGNFFKKWNSISWIVIGSISLLANTLSECMPDISDLRTYQWRHNARLSRLHRLGGGASKCHAGLHTTYADYSPGQSRDHTCTVIFLVLIRDCFTYPFPTMQNVGCITTYWIGILPK